MAIEHDLAGLLETLSPKIRDAFVAAIQEITDDAIIKQVVEAIERRDIDGAFRALGITPPVFNGILTTLASGFETSGLLMMASFPSRVVDASGLQQKLRFNVRDRDAESFLRNQSSRLITAIESDIRTTVRERLETGLREGRNPRNVALDIVGRYNRQTGHREGGVVGLTPRQSATTDRVRAKLENLDASYFEHELRPKRYDEIVRRAIKSGKPLSQDTVDKLTGRYRNNMLRFRGEQIGRTEALSAMNRSSFLATKQSLDQAGLGADAAKKVWDSAADSRVRPSHRALDGQVRPVNEPFVSPLTNARMMHPGDVSLGATGKDVIACRCIVRYEVNFARGVK